MPFCYVKFSRALSCAVFALGLSLQICAQATEGSLHGFVQDPHHAAVANTQINITNLATRQVYTCRTGAQGEYELKSLPAGSYDLDVSVSGFRPVHLSHLQVVSGAQTKDIALEMDTAVQSVKVFALSLDADLKTTPSVLMSTAEALKADSIVFTAKDIEAIQPNDIYDVLKTVPGLEVAYQGRQGNNSMALRGGTLKTIVDGAYLTEAGRQLALFPVQLIESITIVRDATALTIGPLTNFSGMSIANQSSSSNNIGVQGFLIIKTKRSSALDVGFVAYGGNWQTGMGHAYAGNKSGKWDYRLAYTYYSTQGAPDASWTMGMRSASMNFHGGYTGAKLNMDFSYYGLRGSRSDEAGVLALPIWNGASYVNSYSYLGTPYSVGTLQPSSGNLSPNNADVYNLNATYRWNDKNRTLLQYGFYNTHLTTNGYSTSAGSMWDNAKQDNTEGTLNLQHTTCFKGHCLTGGSQFIKLIAPWGIAPNTGMANWKNGVNPNRIDQEVLSWEVQDEWKLPSKHLTFDAGLRSDSLHYGWVLSSLTKSDYWMKPFYTVAAGVSYQVTSKMKIMPRYGFVQSQTPANSVTPAPSSSSYAGITGVSAITAVQNQHRAEISVDYALNRYFSINVAPYGYDTLNGLAQAKTCFTVANAGSANAGNYLAYDASGNPIAYCYTVNASIWTYGLDSKISGQVYGPVTYSAGYGYVAQNVTSNNLAMSHHFVNAQLDYRTKSYFGNFNMVYVGPRWYDTSSLMNKVVNSANPAKFNTGQPALAGYFPYYPLSNYVQLNANAGYNFKLLGKDFSLSFNCRNINNQQASTNTSGGSWTPGGDYGFFPNPGRNYTIQLAGKVFDGRKK